MSGSDYPVDAFTGGSVTGFTPNMSPAQIAEYDRRRGLGDMGAFNDPDLIINKQPWLKPDGTHKAMDKTKEATAILQRALRVPEGEHFAKEKDKNMDDFGDKIFGKAKPPGPGIDRQRERSAGRKERSIALRHIGKGEDGELTSEKDDVDVLERLLAHEKDEMEHEEKGLVTTMGPRGAGGMGGPGGGAAPPPPPAPTTTFPTGGGGGSGASGAGGGAGVGPSMGIGKSMEAIKALNSRSMHIPRPTHDFDPWGVFQSASSVPVSSAQAHETGMTFKAQGDDSEKCETHGVTFRKESGCAQCKIAKCNDCEKCGAGMHKTIGGTKMCPRGH